MMQNDKYFVLTLLFDLNHCGYCFKTTSVCICLMLKKTVSEQLTAKQLPGVWLVTVAFAFLPGFPIDFKAEGKMAFSLIFFCSRRCSISVDGSCKLIKRENIYMARLEVLFGKMVVKILSSKEIYSTFFSCNS